MISRSRRRTRRGVAMAIAAVAVGVAAARSARAEPTAADDDGPVIIGQRPTYETLHFDRPVVGLGLTGIYRDESVKNAGVSSKAKEYFFTESLDLSTTGYLVHPNFLDLNLAAAAGASESVSDVDGVDSGTSYSSLYTWDAKGTFFRAANPLTVFSQREQGWQFPQFGPAIETTTTNSGASLDIRTGAVPTHLGVSHTDSTQTGFRGVDDFSYSRDSLNWFSSAQPASNQTLNWSYNFAATDQNGTTRNSYDTHDASLVHDWLLGTQRQHALRSSVDYSLRTGQTDYQSARWTENLRLKHSDTFSTRYQTNVDQYATAGTPRDRERAAAGFTHKLFKSLVTNGNVGTQHSGGEGSGETIETFADIGFDYDKKVPFGTLDATLAYSWNQQESDAQTQPVKVLDQQAAFSDSQPIVITGTNIDPNSMLITDVSGLVLYRPGIDYRIETFPDRVEITPVLGGRIAPGQTVLLDYDLTPLPSVASTTDTINGGVRYNVDQGPLRGLGVYARYTLSEQSIDSPQPTAFVPNSFVDSIYGAEYTFWNFNVGAEHQMHDSDVNPFDADRLWGRYVRRLDLDTTLQIGTSYSQVRYTGPANAVDVFTVSAVLKHNFTACLTAQATLLYRMESDQLHGDTTGWDEQVELRWHKRQTEVYMLVRNADLDTVGQAENFFFLQMGLRREF